MSAFLFVRAVGFLRSSSFQSSTLYSSSARAAMAIPTASVLQPRRLGSSSGYFCRSSRHSWPMRAINANREIDLAAFTDTAIFSFLVFSVIMVAVKSTNRTPAVVTAVNTWLAWMRTKLCAPTTTPILPCSGYWCFNFCFWFHNSSIGFIASKSSTNDAGLGL